MKFKKFMAAIMAVLMCFGAGHYAFADTIVRLYVVLPDENTEGVKDSYTNTVLKYDETYPYGDFGVGQTIYFSVIPKFYYEVRWYICDAYTEHPDTDGSLISAGNDIDYIVQRNDDHKYLIPDVVYVAPTETYTVTFDTNGHGDNIVIPDIGKGYPVVELIHDTIATGVISHLFEDSVLIDFYIDNVELIEDSIVEGDTVIKEKWGSEIERVELTVEQPVAGDTISVNYDTDPATYENKPVVKNMYTDQYSPVEWLGGYFWYENANIELDKIKLTKPYAPDDDNNWPMIYNGIVKDEQYLFNAELVAEEGYRFTERTEVYINGEKADYVSFASLRGIGGFAKYWRFNESFSCDIDLSVYAFIDTEGEYIVATGISMEQTTYDLDVHDTLKLEPILTPEGAREDTVTYEFITNSDVIGLWDDHTIEPYHTGTAVVRLKAGNEYVDVTINVGEYKKRCTGMIFLSGAESSSAIENANITSSIQFRAGDSGNGSNYSYIERSGYAGPGEQVTLSAARIPGYTFQGWYRLYGHDWMTSEPQEYNKVSSNLSYTFNYDENYRDYVYVAYFTEGEEEAYTLTINTCGHGEDIVIPEITGTPFITEILIECITEGKLSYRDGDKIIETFCLDPEYTQYIDAVSADLGKVNRNVTVYEKWADEIKKVDITVSRPIVGLVSELNSERWPGSYSNGPVVTKNGSNVHYNLYTRCGGAFWGKYCDLSQIELLDVPYGTDGWPETFQGKMDNTSPTYVNVNLLSESGYMFTESTEVYINGVKTDAKSFIPNPGGFGMGYGFGSFWRFNENFTCERSLAVFAPIEPYIEPNPADATVKLVHTEFDLSTWTWFGNLQSITTDYNGNDITVTGTGPVVQGEKASFTINTDGTKAFRAEVSARNAEGEFVYISEFDSLWQDLQFEKTASSKTVEYTVPAESDIIITINIMDQLILRAVNNRPEMYDVQEFTTVNAGEPIEIIFDCQDGYELSSEQQFMGSEGHGNPAWDGSFYNPEKYTMVNPEVVDISVKNRMAWIAGAGEHEIYPNIVFVGYQSNDEKKLEDAVAVEENNNYQNPGIVIYNETEEPKVYTVDLSTGTQQSSQNNMRRFASALTGGATLMSGVVPSSGENGIGDVYLYVTTGKVDDPSSAKQEVIEVSNLSSLTVSIDSGDYVTYSIVKKEDGSQLNKYSYEVTDVTAEEPVVVDKGYVYSDDTVKHLIVSDKIGITSVKLDKAVAEMNIGEGISLSAIVNPADTTEEKTITWSSSDPSVAYVSNDGKVTALKEGEAVITATAVNGVSGECKVTVNGIEMPEEAKFQVTVSSVSQQLHSVGSVTGTVYNDYHGELTVDGVQVNDGNVMVDLWMQNVGSLGVDSLRHYSTTVNRENGREHALKTLTDNIFDPLVGKTITGINGDSKAVYTITKAEGDQYKLIASVNEDDARKLWHQLINENTVRSYTGEDDSKITIAHGSWFNLGDEKLVFEDDYKEDLVLDDFSKLAEMKQNMKDVLRITEGDGSVTVYLEKGSILSVGQSKLELLDELKVTFSLDGSIYEQVFTEASQAADNELLGKVFAIALNAITSLEDNTDVTFEFGHKYADEITYEWAEDYSEVTATLVCENNPDHNVVETVKTTSEVTKPATCIAKGETTYTAVFENESFETQTKTVENVEATGHKPADPVKENNIEPTCTEDGGYDSVVYCSVCHEKLSSEHVVVPKKGHTPGEVKQENVKEATCTEPGSYDEVVRCTVCGEIISSEHKTTEALGHIWSDWVVTKEPTCKEIGQETRECLRCGDIEVRELDKIDHIWDEGKIIVEPTFSNTGLIEYTCTVCGEKKQEELPKGKVINMVVGEESSFTIGVNANNYMYFEPENPDVANASVISTGQRETASGIQYTRKIRVLGDSVGFAKIAMKVNNSTLAYIYAVVSAGNDNVVRCVGDEKVISLTTFDSHTFTISNPDIKLTVAKEQKITKVIIGSETYEAPAYYNTLTLSFDKPVTDKNVTITTEDGEIYYLNVIVSEHDYGKWVYDGPSAKTHTHVCSKDPSHTETQPCEFDEGVVAGNLITYTCKVCGGTYTKDIDNPDDNGVIRIAGDNRFGTSQKIASAYKRLIGQEKVDAVILANGDVFADALAGSYLAAEKQAPIIITRAGKEAEINAYIRSILKEDGSIYILGGTAAVPEACLNGLVGRGYSISRLWGNNRYLTNLAILDSLGVQGDKILVATGNNFADSLSASATGMPILLVRDDGLTEEQREFLSRNSGKEFIILGGTNAVNTKIEAQLTSYGTVRRIAGDNRAKTSIEIAKEFFPDAKIAVTAYSHDFPDGLCGGPLANRLKAPLLLTRDRNADDTAAYMKSKNIKDGYVLGGPVRLTDSLIRKVFGLDASDKIIEFK